MAESPLPHFSVLYTFLTLLFLRESVVPPPPLVPTIQAIPKAMWFTSSISVSYHALQPPPWSLTTSYLCLNSISFHPWLCVMVPGDHNRRGQINQYPQCFVHVCNQQTHARVNELHRISGFQVGGRKNIVEKDSSDSKWEPLPLGKLNGITCLFSLHFCHIVWILTSIWGHHVTYKTMHIQLKTEAARKGNIGVTGPRQRLNERCQGEKFFLKIRGGQTS